VVKAAPAGSVAPAGAEGLARRITTPLTETVAMGETAVTVVAVAAAQAAAAARPSASGGARTPWSSALAPRPTVSSPVAPAAGLVVWLAQMVEQRGTTTSRLSR
jgi:hypothetical protein